MPGGISLIASEFFDAAFSTIEQLTTSSTRARWKTRWDLQSHLAAIISRLLKIASQERNRLAARWATKQLAVIAASSVDCLREIATKDRSDTKRRHIAGLGLAPIHVGLLKYDPVLTKKNSAYRKEKSALTKQRKDVVAARGLIPGILRDELRNPCRYREDLLALRKFGVRSNWRVKPVEAANDAQAAETANKGQPWIPPLLVPKEYQVTLKLKPFSVKTAPKWFQVIIWPQIKRRSRELLPKLRARSKRMKLVDEGDLKSKVIRRRLYLTDFYGEFRNAFLSLARSYAAGTSRSKLQR